MTDTLLAHTVTPLGEGVALHSLVVKAAPAPADGAVPPPPPPPALPPQPPALWTYVEAIWTSTGRREYAGHCPASGVGFRGWLRPGSLPACTPFTTTAAGAGSPSAPPLPQRAGEALLGFPAPLPASPLELPAPTLAPLLALLGSESAAGAAALPHASAAAALAELLAQPLAAWMASGAAARGDRSASTAATPAAAAASVPSTARASNNPVHNRPPYQCRHQSHGDLRSLAFAGPVYESLQALQEHVAAHLTGEWSRFGAASGASGRSLSGWAHACGTLISSNRELRRHHATCPLLAAHPDLYPWAFDRSGPLPPLGGGDDEKDGDGEEDGDDGTARALVPKAVTTAVPSAVAVPRPAPRAEERATAAAAARTAPAAAPPAVLFHGTPPKLMPPGPGFTCMHRSHEGSSALPPTFATAAELRAHVHAEHASGPWPWMDLTPAQTQQHLSSWAAMCAGCGWMDNNGANQTSHASRCRALLAQPAGQPRFYTRADALASPDFGYRCSHRSHYEPGFVAADIPCFITPQALRGHVFSEHYAASEDEGPWYHTYRQPGMVESSRPWATMCVACGKLDKTTTGGLAHAAACGALAAYDAEPHYYVAGE